MKLGDYFAIEKIDKEALEAYAEESDYKEKAAYFILDNWNKSYELMSEKQQAWPLKF